MLACRGVHTQRPHSLCMSLYVLQGVKPHMSLTDMRLARLVCKEWAGELAAAVNTIQLHAELWQSLNTDQVHQLKRLVATYWSFKHAVLLADSQQETQQQAVLAAISTLRNIAALRTITVRNLRAHSNCWSVVLTGIATLAATVTTCNLTDVNLPGPNGLNALTQLTSISQLTISTSSSSKLQQQHLLAVASMQQLQSLTLEFRTMNGSLLQPVTLDCLGNLARLVHLEICYTGEQPTGHPLPLTIVVKVLSCSSAATAALEYVRNPHVMLSSTWILLHIMIVSHQFLTDPLQSCIPINNLAPRTAWYCASLLMSHAM